MNHLLLMHGGSNLYSVPEGLRELMSDITREVLREQPKKIFQFISNYLSVLLITRENGMVAIKILDDLCDCRPMVVDHLVQIGLDRNTAEVVAETIKLEVELEEPIPGQENVQEVFIIKRICSKTEFDDETFAKVSQITVNAFREYWYKKKAMEKSIEFKSDEPWEIAVQRTLEVYKSTKPSITDFNRAALKIEEAYRHYHNHRKMLKHLSQKSEKQTAATESPKKTLDVLLRRFDNKIDVEIGSMLCIKSKEDLTEERQITRNITHILNDEEDNFNEVKEPKLDTGKKTKKTFKFQDPKDDKVTVSYTQIAVRPQFGKTEQNLSLLPERTSVMNTTKDIIDGAGDNFDEIPEVIKSNDDYSDENDDYDIPEDFTDTVSGPSTNLQVSALEALISDIEEDFN